MGIKLVLREKDEDYLVLDKEQFRREIIEDLREICGSTFLIEERDVRKNNGVTLCGISICESGESISPTVYIESMYEEYINGNMNVKEAENEILKAYSKGRTGDERSVNFITDFERVKDKVIFRLINAEKNSEMLRDVPHRRFLDLAVIYTIYIDDVFGRPGNVVIKNDLMSSWGTDEEELHELSMKNTPRIKKPVIRELKDMIMELLSEREMDVMGEDPDESFAEDGAFRMFILTNHDKYYGDAAILYPEFLKEVSESTGMDFYLLPSSVHEFIMIPDDGSVRREDLKELVKSVNETVLDNEDFLSDNIYIYKDSKLSICA